MDGTVLMLDGTVLMQKRKISPNLLNFDFKVFL